MSFLASQQSCLQTLHIESCFVRQDLVKQLVRSLANNKTLKSLSLINLNNVQNLLRFLYKSLADNTTLQQISLAENEIDDYRYIRKLIKKNCYI